MATKKSTPTSRSKDKVEILQRQQVPAQSSFGLEEPKKNNTKTYALITGLALLLGAGLFIFRDKIFLGNIEEDIKRYEARAERYPEDPENYKTLSSLYEKLGKKDFSEKSYDLYQRALHAAENRDDSKRQKELQDLREAILRKNDSGSSAVQRSEITINEGKEKIASTSKQEKAEPNADAILKAAVNLYNAGLKYYDEGKMSEAISKFEEAIKTKSDYAKAYSKIGRIDFEQGNFKAAMAHAEKALAYDNRDEEGHFVEADVFKETKDFAKAEEHYRKVLETNPQNALAFFRLGSLKFREKKYSEAAELYQKSANLDGNNYKAAINLGITKFRLGDNAAAKRSLESALKNPLLQKDNVGLCNAYSQLGKIYDASGDKVRAIENLTKAVSYNKNAADLNQLASLYEETGNPSKAKEYYQAAIATKDDFYEARFNLGLIYYKERNFKEAFSQYSAAINVNGNFIPAIIQAGKCQMELGNADEAKNYFDKAIRIDPNHPTANLELARYYKNKGSSKEAISFAQNALSVAKANDDKIIAYNELGLIYLKWKMYDEGEKALLGARSLQPSNPEVLGNLLNLYLAKDDFEKAVEIDETLLKINKNDFPTYEKLGNLYLKLGKKAEAKDILTKLLELNPNYPNKSKVESLLKSI